MITKKSNVKMFYFLVVVSYQIPPITIIPLHTMKKSFFIYTTFLSFYNFKYKPKFFLPTKANSRQHNSQTFESVCFYYDNWGNQIRNIADLNDPEAAAGRKVWNDNNCITCATNYLKSLYPDTNYC